MYALPAYEMTAEDRAEEAAERREEAIEALVAQYQQDDDKRAEAEQWTAGTFDSSHYAEVTLALHRLHHTDPSDLMDSGLLPILYPLAKVQADALDAELRRMAETEYDRSEAA